MHFQALVIVLYLSKVKDLWWLVITLVMVKLVFTFDRERTSEFDFNNDPSFFKDGNCENIVLNDSISNS